MMDLAPRWVCWAWLFIAAGGLPIHQAAGLALFPIQGSEYISEPDELRGTRQPVSPTDSTYGIYDARFSEGPEDLRHVIGRNVATRGEFSAVLEFAWRPLGQRRQRA